MDELNCDVFSLFRGIWQALLVYASLKGEFLLEIASEILQVLLSHLRPGDVRLHVFALCLLFLC